MKCKMRTRMQRIDKKLDRIFQINFEINDLINDAVDRVEMLEMYMRQIARTVRANKKGEVIVTCFSGEQYELKHYIRITLNENA